MRITGFIWMEHILDKLWDKHNVTQDEVEEVCLARPLVRFVERGHRKGEDIYTAQGRTASGRYLIVFFVRKTDGRALIVSARDMARVERRRYEQA